MLIDTNIEKQFDASLLIVNEAYKQDKISLNDYSVLIEKASKYGHGKRKQLIPVKLKSGKTIYQRREVGIGELDKLVYTPFPELSTDLRQIETKFGKYLNDNLEKLTDEYIKVNDNLLGADNAKELSDDYQKDKAKYSVAVHEPTSAFVKYLYNKMLNDEHVDKTKQNTVVFTAGGPGAGKTSGVKGIKKLNQLNNNAQIVYDTSMTNFSSAKNKIDQALAHNKNIHVIYTYRDIVDSFEHGNLPRSKKIGRVVPIKVHVEGHIKSYQTIKRLQEEYKNNSKVIFDIIDNSLGAGKAKSINYDKLQQKVKFDKQENYLITLNKLIEDEYEKRQITRSQYEGFTGKEPSGASTTVPGTNSTNGKEPERVSETRTEIAEELTKSLDIIKLAFDNNQIDEKQYFDALEKGRRAFPIGTLDESKTHIKTAKGWSRVKKDKKVKIRI